MFVRAKQLRKHVLLDNKINKNLLKVAENLSVTTIWQLIEMKMKPCVSVHRVHVRILL